MSTERDKLGKLLFTLPVSDRAADTAPEIMTLCDEAAEAILEAGYREPFHLSPGLYQNKRGVKIRIEALRMDRGIIGPIWDASVLDDVFGNRHVVVTPQGLLESGYTRIEGAE